jgi:hypothetical protein
MMSSRTVETIEPKLCQRCHDGIHWNQDIVHCQPHVALEDLPHRCARGGHQLHNPEPKLSWPLH